MLLNSCYPTAEGCPFLLFTTISEHVHLSAISLSKLLNPYKVFFFYPAFSLSPYKTQKESLLVTT